MKNKKNIEESFQFGPIQVSRSGEVVSMKNVGNEYDNDEFIKNLASQHKEVSSQMDNLVNEIKNLISTCNPLELLKYAYDNFIKYACGVTSESQLSMQEVYGSRELEYIQSVIVASENKYIENNDKDSMLETFQLISLKINELYKLTQVYFMCRTADLKSRSDIDLDLDKEQFLVEAQLSMFVRGDRYQIYEVLHLKELLEPHNDEFIKLYNITSNDFIDGISNIQKSLTRTQNPFGNIFGQELNGLLKIFEEYKEFEEKELETDKNQITEDIMKMFKKNNLKSTRIDLVNDYDRFDLEKLTNWPKGLLKDFSFGINENKNFYNNEYPGSPLTELPVFEKPFINIGDKFYCFDYYNLFDNIYRVIQKVFRSKDLEYRDVWGIRQMEVTENMVSNLFKKLLPNCTIYTSNYYPKNKSLKQCNENDIIVLYDDNLIIVEVKAGSYTYRSPILDIESHIESLKTLVEKADGQAERTLNYLKSGKTVKLYNKDKSEKCEITLENFNEVTLMSITLDNFNEFCSKIEKLKFLEINKNSIALSIDDFRVYSDYFDSPSEFLHYLKQRKIATQNKYLYLNDELDHLGMYIEHNVYSNIFEDDLDAHVVPYGYRERIDEYFSSLVNEGFEEDKPKQLIPIEIRKIIDFLDKSNIKQKVRLSTFLLDFCSETKKDLSNMISKALTRQIEINRMIQLSLMGETPICIFCHQPNIENMTDSDIQDYTFATMLYAKDKYRVELHLYYDTSSMISDIKFNIYTFEDIPLNRVEKLQDMAKGMSISRINNDKIQNRIPKVGRNELCPCGSGKKYKKCHGK